MSDPNASLRKFLIANLVSLLLLAAAFVGFLLKQENRMTLVEAATAAQPVKDAAQDLALRESMQEIKRSIEALWQRRSDRGVR